MATFSLSLARWRMVRLALHAKRFRFKDVRNMHRHDQKDFDWLVSEGFFAEVATGQFELTGKGHDSADLGFYQWEPPRAAPVKTEATGRTRGAKSPRAGRRKPV